ncbi:flagellar basal body rod protein FlgC [Hydrogenophilus thermoluteolus]|jgi:flagellar basal-body rod protein FlgC|uniref:Flagellar basal-body rod protein FlgC n=1 Tax=Hydrogenophilus thermoluteolus TaxID=297 RepID=A0A2Z6DZ63_HYDTE|nr:flagellar basal body rod protein FlgC [Hydrogenophilus thermoluteolus]HCO76680.1 flagellar basal body rod protein FlgC [Rhodocyclaceae bacterium]MBW7657023.1 flagellar basal body rod protein FlgC [Hydrogenophilus thermoluteolus]BBD77811.1 flagellar basal body rod protein FlgC [Hydrogenophilus thermoluteolus]HNQ49257.1 flagellar basal body rod protein FlgC [Hydrogenophilus thermoluteolus]HNU20427.1 flagellar basal body rod protein FlgC [Hydrogenophilus thermoluteolus]
MSLLNVFQVAGSALSAQSVRLNTTASNLANVESVVDENGQPYRSKQVVFQVRPIQGEVAKGVRVKEIVESAAPFRMVYDPHNPAADANGYVRMPNVNVVEEMVNMISASRSYQNNVEVMNTARDLLKKTLSIGQ